MKNSESIHLVVTIFCMRRMFVAISTIFGNQAIIIDIYLNIFGCMGMIKFFFDFKPMNQAFLNQFEIFNEISLLFIYYFMFLFTDFIPDVEFRYTLGFYFIYLVGAVFFINLVLVIYSMIYAIYFDIRKKYAKKKWDQYDEVFEKMQDYVEYHPKRDASDLNFQELRDKIDRIMELKRQGVDIVQVLD